MKKIAVTLLIAAMTTATSHAILVNLTLGDGRYLGQIDDGIPSSEANELAWVNQLIDMTPGTGPLASIVGSEFLTRSSNVFAGLTDATGGSKVEDASNRTVGDNAIALGKYGAGGTAKMTHVWYIGDLASDDIVNMSGARAGLSHTNLFLGERTTVPDSGSTLLLLGLGLGLLGFLRRRK